ncbi:50S ribosomal protein L6 [Candidatus Curtissbacteria bacterium]|nr:50S ribosomal protein L6 [Candidatus Curtissbacteria bacterium]
MSKIGNLPILIPQGVTVTKVASDIKVSGPKGNLSFSVHPQITIEVEGDKIKVARKSETKFAKSLHGLTRSIIANMVKGVVDGHQKILEVVGVGYRAAKQGENLVLNVGYSHPVVITPLTGIEFDTKENKIIVSGANKVVVGEMAARIRRVKPPEPYKGKGIKYLDEVIRRKPGKTVKAVGGGTQ